MRWLGIQRAPTLVLLLSISTSWADKAVLHLRTGDRITGELISEGSTHITITNRVLGKVVVPLNEVERVERLPGVTDQAEFPQAIARPKPPAHTPDAASKPKPNPPKSWNAEAQAGVDLQYAEKDRHILYSRLKATYVKDRNRSVLDYKINYGTTDGELSANDMDGNIRLERDVSQRLFVFDAAGAGYNEIRRIDFTWDDSVGLGYKVFTRTNVALNADFGANYQEQYFSDDEAKRSFSLRLGESVTWKLNSKLGLNEKLEYYPRFSGLDDYRIRFESNFRYLLLENLSLNLTVIDQYDTEPARGVAPNDLLLRSTIGVRF